MNFILTKAEMLAKASKILLLAAGVLLSANESIAMHDVHHHHHAKPHHAHHHAHAMVAKNHMSTLVKKELGSLEKEKHITLTNQLKDWIAYLCGEKGVHFKSEPGKKKGEMRKFPFSSQADFRRTKDKALDKHHEYIQIVLPNRKAGTFWKDYCLDNKKLVKKSAKGIENPYNVLNILLKNKKSTIAKQMQYNAKENMLRLLHLWGFKAAMNHNKLVIKKEFNERIRRQLSEKNIHHPKKMSRLLKFLNILGNNCYVKEIQAALAATKKKIPEVYKQYKQYWTKEKISK
ncbi:hypothetical protein FACS1894122_08890 [Alphaproteobacteria bacterium]|nr:hypothetical protein FACS1894122_08890 [Alphaproteobacteria bacterium]